jgi:hypothetical protein
MAYRLGVRIVSDAAELPRLVPGARHRSEVTNGQPFGSLDQFNDRIGRLPAGAPAALLVRRGDTVLFLP